MSPQALFQLNRNYFDRFLPTTTLMVKFPRYPIITSPDPASHYRPKKEQTVPCFQCSICQYIYDPVKGDIENGVLPGTLFEELSDTWVCPQCGAGKDMFEPVD
jgi:rubredoxin